MKVKVVILINTIDKHGPGNVILNIIKNIDYNKFEINLVTFMKGDNKKIVEELEKNGIIIKEFECKNKATFLLQTRKIVKYIDNMNCDIVHSHGIMPDYISNKTKNKAKKITTLHNNIFEDYNTSFNKIVAKLAIHFNLKYYNNMDLNICCSKSIYDAMKSKIKNATYVTNGVDVDNYINNNSITRKKLEISNKDVVFLFAGKLIKRKNVAVLIDLFKKYHNSNEFLLIAGNGEEFDLCKERAEDDKNIKLLGFQKNIYDYMNLADVYISGSLSEGMSISCLEALNFGNYLFLSKIASHSEIIETSDMYIGELFENENFEEQLKKLRKNIKNNGSKYRKEIKNIHDRLFSSEVMSKKYQHKYLEMVSDSHHE